MLRASLAICVALALLALDAQFVFAQGLIAQASDAWPVTEGSFTRGPGFYLNFWKLGSVWVLFVAWAATADWLSRDCLKLKLNYNLWNGVEVGAFFATLLLFWIIPGSWSFWLGFPLLLIAYGAPLATYVIMRNKRVSEEQRILTRDHLRFLAAELAARVGIKLAGKKADPRDAGPTVKFTALGGAAPRDNEANQLKVRNMPGFLAARETIDAALKRRGDGVLLDYGRQTVAVRHQVDGVWIEAPNLERAYADPMLEVFKTLAALNPADRRGRQAGRFGVETGGVKYDCRFNSQGTETGERAVLLLDNKKLAFKTLEELGMRAKIAEQLLELAKRKEGFLLFASTPGNGQTTALDVTLLATDRYIRNFAAVEDADKPERDIENIQVTTYRAAAGEGPDTVLPGLIRTYPDVFVVRDLVNGETVDILCGQVTNENRQVFATIRAKEAVEALLRVLLLKASPADFANVITAVVNSRLVRKLCEACKEGYAPPANVLQQLGLPPGKVAAFYRPPTKPIDPKHPEKKCEACKGVGYIGRTGIYELLIVDDRMRQILANTPKLELLREAARAAKHRSLQEEGILLAVRGVTSLAEISRVLKG